MLTTDDIREKFLAYFESQGCKRLPADKLVPENDKTLLFTGSGMNQFKAQFNGIGIEFPRVTTSQTCIRTGDIENVGRTARHHTFFEMLGYFSFGDFFKEEAIPWIWNFYVNEMKIPVGKLSVSVYEEDDEAYGIWKKIIPENKIFRLGEDDNFWPAGAPTKGPNGVCGPCSELFYDMGDIGDCEDSKKCQPGCDCGRFLEIGNIVFTQFDRKEGGQLDPLPQKNIDFGGGLERLAAVVQGVSSNFEIDILADLANCIQKGLGVDSDLKGDSLRRLRRIVDHLRTVVFCIAEGVKPSPNNQGYVIRRLLRRAILDVHELGVNEPVLYGFVTDVADVMKGGYPDLPGEVQRIAMVVKDEEKSFFRTLKTGKQKLLNHVLKLNEKNKKTLSGDVAFDLYSTYGFPYELTEEILELEGLSVDREGFLAAQQEDRTRDKPKSKSDVFIESPALTAKKYVSDTLFKGYEQLTGTTHAKILFDTEAKVDSLRQGDKGLLVVEETPFYAESGGQLGDQGQGCSSSSQFEVVDTYKEAGIFLHRIKLTEGELCTGDEVDLKVDEAKRKATMANHSATHLLQWALKKILGDNVSQAGSQVGAETLRFDFSYSSPLSEKEIDQVESLVNDEIWNAVSASSEEMSIDEARATGAIAMFGEKYGDKVRVVTLGSSVELCGGTHVLNTGFIGAFKIISQESVGSGVRRITALTRDNALRWQKKKLKLLSSTAKNLKITADNLPKRVMELADENQKLKKEIQAFKQSQSAAQGQDLKNKSEEISDLTVLMEELDESLDPMSVADGLKGEIDVIFLASTGKNKVNLLISCSKKAQKNGLTSGDLLKSVVRHVDGKGGGKPALARGSGKKPSGVAAAFDELRKCLSA